MVTTYREVKKVSSKYEALELALISMIAAGVCGKPIDDMSRRVQEAWDENKRVAHAWLDGWHSK